MRDIRSLFCFSLLSCLVACGGTVNSSGSDPSGGAPASDNGNGSSSSTSTGVLAAAGADTITLHHAVGGEATGCASLTDFIVSLSTKQLTRKDCTAMPPAAAPLTVTLTRALTAAELADIQTELQKLTVAAAAPTCDGNGDGDHFVLDVTGGSEPGSYSDQDYLCEHTAGMRYLDVGLNGLYVDLNSLK